MVKRKGKWAVWVHPKSGKSDYWYDFPSKEEALEGRKKLKLSGKFAHIEMPVLYYGKIPN